MSNVKCLCITIDITNNWCQQVNKSISQQAMQQCGKNQQYTKQANNQQPTSQHVTQENNIQPVIGVVAHHCRHYAIWHHRCQCWTRASAPRKLTSADAAAASTALSCIELQTWTSGCMPHLRRGQDRRWWWLWSFFWHLAIAHPSDIGSRSARSAFYARIFGTNKWANFMWLAWFRYVLYWKMIIIIFNLI